MLSKQECDEIRERADKATEGGWYWIFHDYSAITLAIDGTDFFVKDILTVTRCKGCQEHDKEATELPQGPTKFRCGWPIKPDAEFIAHARTDIPALLDTIDELRTKLADLAEWCAELEHCAQEQLR